MHELSIALSILEFAEEEAERRGERVSAIHIRIGALSGVVKEALLSAFELARETTALCNAYLVIEETPVTIDCPACGVEQPAHSAQRLCCRICGAPATNVRQGQELQVTALELVT